MKRTSASVLALLFASSKAIKLNKVEGYEAVDDGAEKVHVLDQGMNTMSNTPFANYPADAVSHDGAFAFPNIRTAYYAQLGDNVEYDGENGLWRQNLVQRHRRDDGHGVTAVRGPPEGQIGDNVYEHAMNATDGIPGDRSKQLGPSFIQRKKKVDPISPENYDPWVYKYSWDQMGPYPQWQLGDEFTGYSRAQNKKHHKKHHSKKDIAERGMMEEVHTFATDALPPLNTRVKSTLPFIPNGSDPSAFEGAASVSQAGYSNTFAEGKHHKKHHKHHKPDVAERDMDEEVHGFVADKVSRVNEIEHDKKAPAMNGKNAFVQHKKKAKDMGERGYDEEVYDFAHEMVSAINGQERSATPYEPNGIYGWDYDTLAQKKHHNKHHKKDIAERGMDEEVHNFATDILPPLNTRVRSTLPFIPNGSDPSAWQGAASESMAGYSNTFSEKKHHHHRKHHKKPDVAERGMDEEVHGFVSEYTPPLNVMKKSDQAFIPNGSDPSAHEPSFSQNKHHRRHHKKDVAERGMDEEVHGFVWHALPPLNTWERSNEPFIPNGSDESAFDPSFYAKNPDIIGKPSWADDEVEPFTTDALPPLSEQWGSDHAWVPNGSNPSAHDSLSEKRNHRKHHGRSDQEFVPSSSEIGDWNENALAQRQALYQSAPSGMKDIAERSMENHFVHPFSAEQDVVLPTANPWLRPYLPYEANGGSNVYAQVGAAPRKDIANKEVRPDVWVEVHKHVNPIAWGRYREPREVDEPEERTWDDGPKPKEGPAPEFKFKKPEEPDLDAMKEKAKADAAENKEKAKAEKAQKAKEDAEPDEEAAGKTVEKKEPPKESKEDAEKAKAKEEEDKKADEAAEKQEAEAAAAKAKKDEEAKKASLAQVKSTTATAKQAVATQKADGDKKADGEKKEGDEPAPTPEPEKVHVLEPTEYKEKADTNTPNIRTTFYDKKNSKKTQNQL